MEKFRSEWEELKSFLPEGWERKARESKAICRTRKVGSAEELLEKLGTQASKPEWLENYRVWAIDGSYIS